MAHFAELNENNIVTRIIVVNNNELLIDGVENEQKGIAFCLTLFAGNWIQTSYNCNFRKNYAAIGDSYDSQLDAFIAPKPYPSWLLDEATCQWKAPVDYPTDGGDYLWNEATIQWEHFTPIVSGDGD